MHIHVVEPGPEAHDYMAHGEIVDFVMIMTYEWGYSGGPAQALSPIGPVRSCAVHSGQIQSDEGTGTEGMSYWKLGLSFPQNWLLVEDNFHVAKRV